MIPTLVLLYAASVSHARPEFLDTFMPTYRISPNSAIGQASCGLCHASDEDFPHFNPYGRDLKKALADADLTELDASILRSVEKLDSTGSGVTNGTKIAKGILPGAQLSVFRGV